MTTRSSTTGWCKMSRSDMCSLLWHALTITRAATVKCIRQTEQGRGRSLDNTGQIAYGVLVLISPSDFSVPTAM